MTRRAGRSAANDPGLNAILQTKARTGLHGRQDLGLPCRRAPRARSHEYIDMIGDSIAHAKTRMDEVMFDAEHFFDGYKANPDYAMACLKAAEANGARWLVLCDTNGGTLPHEIERIVGEVVEEDSRATASASTPTTTPRTPSPTRWPPCAPACARCRARSTAWASVAAMPT
jgi:2-isopropylmalate synthase